MPAAGDLSGDGHGRGGTLCISGLTLGVRGGYEYPSAFFFRISLFRSYSSRNFALRVMIHSIEDRD